MPIMALLDELSGTQLSDLLFHIITDDDTT